MRDAPLRILLIDHLRAFRTCFAFVLDHEAEFTVACQAGTVAETSIALAQIQDPVDIAITELGFADGTLDELIGVVRATSPECRFLALTNQSELRVHADAIVAGYAGVLDKSTALETIIEAIHCLGRGEAPQPVSELIDLLRLANRAGNQGRAVAEGLNRLTDREREILQQLADGHSDKEIARRLGISANTVAAHNVHILRKLGVHTRLQAVLLALKHNVVELR